MPDRRRTIRGTRPDDDLRAGRRRTSAIGPRASSCRDEAVHSDRGSHRADCPGNHHNSGELPQSSLAGFGVTRREELARTGIRGELLLAVHAIDLLRSPS